MSQCILVVEDQEDNRQILRDLLTFSGFEIIEATDGAQALDAITKRRPDLILMDIQLPVMDGYQATRRIKADPATKDIPIIVVTSYALSGDEAKARGGQRRLCREALQPASPSHQDSRVFGLAW
jgi:two-component system cell cycle response regulator DivK